MTLSSKPGSRRRVAWVALGAVVLAMPAGCVKPLFPKDEPRTQYDRYDRIRGEWVPATVTDPYGRAQENVRARMLRKR